MRKIYLILIAFIVISNTYSQEVYFITGTNITKYNFSSDLGTMKTPLFSGTGFTYELGYVRPLFIKHFSYTIGLNLNDYNVAAGDFANSYKWNTKYLGLSNSIDFDFTVIEDVQLVLKAGLNLSTIIYGRQEVNGALFDITKLNEFSGLIFVPFTGLNLKYNINDNEYLSFGYAFSKGFKLFNNSNEKLSITTNQIVLGIHFIIN